MPNGRCRLHGGLTPSGMASPHFRHGRYSKYLPAQLASQYKEAQNDEHLLELSDEVALLDVRLGELVSGLDRNDTQSAWLEVGKIYQGILRAGKARDVNALNSYVQDLGDVIERQADTTSRWNEITILMDQRRKLVESERKRTVEMQMTITAERAMLLIAALVDIVRRHVDDRTILRAISTDVGKLIGTDV